MGGYPEGEGKKKVPEGSPSLWTISTDRVLCLVHRRGSRYLHLPNTAIMQSNDGDDHIGESMAETQLPWEKQETNAR